MKRQSVSRTMVLTSANQSCLASAVATKQVPLPASCTMKIIASSGPTWFAGLLRGEARFEASWKEAMQKNLHPPSPSFQNHHPISGFLKKIHRREKVYAVKDPPFGYQASPLQRTAKHSALPETPSSDDAVLAIFMPGKPYILPLPPLAIQAGH